MRSCGPARYTTFMADVVMQMCNRGDLPRTQSKAWPRRKIVEQIGAEVALHPDCPAKVGLKKNVSRAIEAANSQFGNICHILGERFASGEPNAWMMICLSGVGIYCTNNPADPNREKMFSNRKASADGIGRSANSSRRADETRIEISEKVIEFRPRDSAA